MVKLTPCLSSFMQIWDDFAVYCVAKPKKMDKNVFAPMARPTSFGSVSTSPCLEVPGGGRVTTCAGRFALRRGVIYDVTPCVTKFHENSDGMYGIRGGDTGESVLYPRGLLIPRHLPYPNILIPHK